MDKSIVFNFAFYLYNSLISFSVDLTELHGLAKESSLLLLYFVNNW